MVPTAQAVERILEDIPGASDVKVEQTEGLPVMNIDIDRAALARYGINVADGFSDAALTRSRKRLGP